MMVAPTGGAAAVAGLVAGHDPCQPSAFSGPSHNATARLDSRVEIDDGTISVQTPGLLIRSRGRNVATDQC